MRPSRITATRSAIDSASSWSCVMCSVAMPCSRWMRRISSRIASARRRIERRQRLVEQQGVRSKDQRAGQRHALLLAAGKLRRAGVRRSPPRPTRSSASSARAAARSPRRGRALAADRRRSPRRACAETARSDWNTMPRLRARGAGTRSRPRPPRRDAAARRAPGSRRSVSASVDLPQPLGPITATNSPAPIARSTSRTPASRARIAVSSRRRAATASALMRRAAPDARLLRRARARGRRAMQQRQHQQHDGGGAGEAGRAVERLQQHDRIGPGEEAGDEVESWNSPIDSAATMIRPDARLWRSDGRTISKKPLRSPAPSDSAASLERRARSRWRMSATRVCSR